MSRTTTPDERLDRRRRALAGALVVGAATTVVTGCAHAVAGGAAPDALLVGAALVATLLVLAPVLGPRATPGRRVLAVTLAQLVQHALYSLPSASAGVVPGHRHDAAVALDAAAAAHPHTAMPLAHVAAGLVTLWLLHAVPRIVDAALRSMSLRRAVAALSWTPPARRRASVTATRPASSAALDVLRDALERRGPPLLVG